MRNLISEIVKKCTAFPVHPNRTLRLQLFVPPTSLNVSVVARFSIFAFFVRMAIFSNSRCASWYLIWILANPLAIFHLIRHFSIARISGHKCTITSWTKTFLPLKGKSSSFTSQCWQRGAGGGGFPQAIMSMIPGYSSNRKQKETGPKELLSCSVPRLLTNPQLEILVKALVLIPRGARSVSLHPRGSNPFPHTLQVSGLPAELVLTW